MKTLLKEREGTGTPEKLQEINGAGGSNLQIVVGYRTFLDQRLVIVQDHLLSYVTPKLPRLHEASRCYS